MLRKKAEITERKYKSHDSENFFETMSYQYSTKESLRGSLGNRNEDIRQLYKSEKKCNREMKSLKNKKKATYNGQALQHTLWYEEDQEDTC